MNIGQALMFYIGPSKIPSVINGRIFEREFILVTKKSVQNGHCMKSVQIRSFSGSYFPARIRAE